MLARMDLELRPISEDERPAFHRSIATAFGAIPTDDRLEQWEPVAAERTLAVFDDDEVVATAGAYSFTLSVPGGGQVATAGVTIVGVRPTHRRRGLLTRLMDAQLDDVAHRGEPIAALTASETAIYGRFGYGQATSVAHWRLSTDHAALSEPSRASGRVRLLQRDDALAVVPAVYRAVAEQRVGEVTRTADLWARVYAERSGPASPDGDGAPFFTVVHENVTGEVDGFARYAITMKGDLGIQVNELTVFELHALDPEIETALWEFVLGVDLVSVVEARDRRVDDSLRWRLADPRRLQVTQVTDHLWVRVLDVAAALSARTYAVADALVLELTDTFRPGNDGCWLVDGGPDGATCARTDRTPDLAMSIADLGALFLGGVAPSTLAAAGRVRERTPGALARADVCFTIHPAPWCTTHF
jgi:predicted acetyltransferase